MRVFDGARAGGAGRRAAQPDGDDRWRVALAGRPARRRLHGDLPRRLRRLAPRLRRLLLHRRRGRGRAAERRPAARGHRGRAGDGDGARRRARRPVRGDRARRRARCSSCALCCAAVRRAQATAPRRGRALLRVAAVAGVVASLAGLLLRRRAGARARPCGRSSSRCRHARSTVAWALAARSPGSSCWRAAPARAGPTAARRRAAVPFPPLGGHASVEGPLMLAANVVHVVAIAGWIGGLAVLVFALGPARATGRTARRCSAGRRRRSRRWRGAVGRRAGHGHRPVDHRAVSAWRELTEHRATGARS